MRLQLASYYCWADDDLLDNVRFTVRFTAPEADRIGGGKAPHNDLIVQVTTSFK